MSLDESISDPDEFIPKPPNAARVAARALVLSAVCCRALIESDAHKPGAEELRQKIARWLNTIGASEEMEPSENDLLSTPLGKLDQETTKDAGWKSEGMVVLAWALGFADLPPVHLECEPNEIANKMGFLDERRNTALHAPRLRYPRQIEDWTDTYLTLHWRLRQFHQKREAMDFVQFVRRCEWASLRLDHLEIIDKDLAVEGVPLHMVEERVFRKSLSITQERHQAFNWLLGFEILYSEVTTDT